MTSYNDLGDGYKFDTTVVRPPFDSHATALLARYDHLTTYVTTVGLPVCEVMYRVYI